MNIKKNMKIRSYHEPPTGPLCEQVSRGPKSDPKPRIVNLPPSLAPYRETLEQDPQKKSKRYYWRKPEEEDDMSEVKTVETTDEDLSLNDIIKRIQYLEDVIPRAKNRAQ